MFLKNKAILTVALVCITTISFAQKAKTNASNEKYNTWSLGVGLSSLNLRGDLDSYGAGNSTNLGYYIYADKMFNSIFGIELKLDYGDLGATNGAFYGDNAIEGIDETLYGGQYLSMDGTKLAFGVNGIVNLSNLWNVKSKKWNWSLIAGVGLNNYDVTLYDDNDVSIQNYEGEQSVFINGGIDVKYRLNKRFDISLRPTINLNFNDNLDAAISNRNSLDSYTSTHIGIVYKIGKEKKHAIWIHHEDEEPVAEVDVDGDGVLDHKDEELDTPVGALVYANGVSVDSDKDGVSDFLDNCPLVKGIVENDGCPEDRDNDGVYDFDDVCPDVVGVAENLGCPRDYTTDMITNKVFLLSKNIYFKPFSDQIFGESFEILNKISDIMLQYPNTQFTVDGHSDIVGTEERNISISKRRAASVKNHLIKKGVKENRLYDNGYGYSRPTYSNDTEEGRKQNRRVEINFIQPDSEKGLEVYEEGINVTESLELVQPIPNNSEDSEENNTPDSLDQEKTTTEEPK